jgi:hypothetical protein
MPSLFIEIGSFCLRWPQVTVLPNSASQVAGITGICYHVQHLKIFVIDDLIEVRYILHILRPYKGRNLTTLIV